MLTDADCVTSHAVAHTHARYCPSDLEVNESTLSQLASSCDEFLVHGVDVEGKQLGIDDELVSLLGNCSPIPVTYAGGARTMVHGHHHGCAWPCRWLSSGIVFWGNSHRTRTQDDLNRVQQCGQGRVDITVGSALDIFGGSLPYSDVVAWHRQQRATAMH